MNSKSLADEARKVLLQLVECIHHLNYDEYTQKISLLSDSTIGEHTRHIIELFEQLSSGYESNNVNYDNRRRDIRIQQDIDFAMESIAILIQQLERKDKKLFLSTLYNDQELKVETNYFRELLYNIEHCIHHQAIIKIGLLHLGITNPLPDFGVAKSTLVYRKECAQ